MIDVNAWKDKHLIRALDTNGNYVNDNGVDMQLYYDVMADLLDLRENPIPVDFIELPSLFDSDDVVKIIRKGFKLVK